MNTMMHQVTEWNRVRTELLPLLQVRVLSEAHLSTALRLAALFGESSTAVVLAFAMAMRAPSAGSMRVGLLDPALLDARAMATATGIPVELSRLLAASGRREWLRLVSLSPAVTSLHGKAASGSTDVRPFVCTEDGHLYVHRYWQYEQQIAAHLVRLAAARHEWNPRGAVTGLRSLTAWLRASLSPNVQNGGAELSAAAEKNLANEPDAQDIAVATGVLSSLLVLTGGPGTGKTSTVRNLITALHLGHTGGRPLQVVVAAPTGKAAARVKESLGIGLENWAEGLEGAMRRPDRGPDHEQIQRIRSSIESQPCLTLHRLLGWQSRDPSRFRHDRANPLPYDVIIVDEASMVDALLMAKLLDAIPSGARLVLMGDRNQLSSVDVGTVLGDICLSAQSGTGIGTAGDRADVRALLGLRAATQSPMARPVAECTVELVQSHRFDAEQPIGQLAASIQKGKAQWHDYPQAISLKAADGVYFVKPMVGQQELLEPNWKFEQRVYRISAGTLLYEGARSGYESYLKQMRRIRQLTTKPEKASTGGSADASPPVISDVELKLAFQALNQYRILCSHRDNPWGVIALNEQLSRLIRDEIRYLGAESVPAVDEGRAVRSPEWWHGRAIMVRRNDYSLQLFNGDVGITIGEGSSAVVVFPSEQGGFRTLSPAMLPEHETAFALTVHKSQGSEFTRILLVLPPTITELLTRELVYTALTRAKTGAAIYGSPASFDAACARGVARASGIRELLEG